LKPPPPTPHPAQHESLSYLVLDSLRDPEKLQQAWDLQGKMCPVGEFARLVNITMVYICLYMGGILYLNLMAVYICLYMFIYGRVIYLNLMG
jgi:hypothetical protein